MQVFEQQIKRYCVFFKVFMVISKKCTFLNPQKDKNNKFLTATLFRKTRDGYERKARARQKQIESKLTRDLFAFRLTLLSSKQANFSDYIPKNRLNFRIIFQKMIDFFGFLTK